LDRGPISLAAAARLNHLGRHLDLALIEEPAVLDLGPWRQAVNVAGWITFFLGFALWAIVLIWAYVDVPAKPRQEVAPP
jgi:hypothetical protein